jgi:elongator complex protein 1
LRELKALEPFYQRFKIDDHLKKYSKALANLHEAGKPTLAPNGLKCWRIQGSKYFEEALKYTEKHQLYGEAVTLWKDEPQEYKVHTSFNLYMKLTRLPDYYGSIWRLVDGPKRVPGCLIGQVFTPYSSASYLTSICPAFELAEKPSKSMLAYEKDLAWKPLFALATRNKLTQDKIQEIAYRIAGRNLNHASIHIF